MAKTIPSPVVLIDPIASIHPGAFAQVQDYQHPLEAMNWLYSRCRRVVLSESLGDAVPMRQGAGSTVSTSLATKVLRMRALMYVRACATGLDLLKVAALADRDVGNGQIDVEIFARDFSGAALDSVALTVSGTTPTLVTGTFSGGALTQGTRYGIKVSLTANAGAGAAVRLYHLAIWESAVALADMPTGP